MGKFTFSKEEKITSQKQIKELFNRGSSFVLYPFRVIYLPHPNQLYPSNQVLISVPVRHFKRAVARNTIKRRIREGYRLNKSMMETTQKWLIAYIYTAKEIAPSVTIHEKLSLTFERFKEKK